MNAIHLAIAKSIAEGRSEAYVDRLLAKCTDDECNVCGIICCPHEDFMHFHHDGCTSCPIELEQYWL